MKKGVPIALGIAALKAASVAAPAAKTAYKFHTWKQQMQLGKRLQRKEVVIMKKSTFAAMLIVLAAIAGALGAAFLYLRRREAELDEYEQLLFSEDFSEEICEPEDDAEEIAEDDIAEEEVVEE